ncbi:hypothetical protein GGS20DRAFT_569479 [Poronia punctata]|nr:hypothetical protein GGS20DRAFT_569479 [Poronia punctata]
MDASYGRTMAEERHHSLITTALIIVSVIFPLLSLCALVLRIKARRVTRAPLLADDWWMVATWIFTLSLSINVWIFAHLIGIDYYKDDFVTGNKNSALCLVVSSLLTQSDLTSVKISILLFYKRIFSTKPFHIIVWLSIGAVSVWGITTFFVILFQGDPREFITKGKQEFTLDPIAVGYTQVVGTLVLDFFVLFLALPMVFRLHMPFKRKIGVSLIFSLGFFCCIAALVRVILIHQLHQHIIDQPSLVATQSSQFIFLLIEPHASIIAACLPCYAPLYGLGKSVLLRSYASINSLRNHARSIAGRTGLSSSSTTGSQSVLFRTDDAGWLRSDNTVRIESSPVGGGGGGGTGKYSHIAETISLQEVQGIQVTRGVDVVKS